MKDRETNVRDNAKQARDRENKVRELSISFFCIALIIFLLSS